MNIKKFIGKNMTEVMIQIKREMGEDAIILQSKKIKTGGFLGLFKKEQLEVLAAVEYEPKISRNARAERNIGNSNQKSNDYSPINKEMSHTEKKYGDNKKDDWNPKEEKQETPQEKENFQKEIDEIKKAVIEINSRVTTAFRNEEDETREAVFNYWYTDLTKRGISGELSKKIINIATGIKDNPNKNDIISIIIKNYSQFENGPVMEGSKLNIFVGPTGVGKTTTLAKLASNMAIAQNKKIGFLTLDTYRIAAVEQLKTYAEILNCPIEVAYDKEDILIAMSRLTNRDLVYIDTAGRSHRNKKHMQELNEVLAEIHDGQVFLTIAANYNLEDIKDIIEKFSFINHFNIIVTKTDETESTGIILDIIDTLHLMPAYVTYGQNVPDDIEVFHFEKYINELFRENI